jgi:hypothetical protein
LGQPNSVATEIQSGGAGKINPPGNEIYLRGEEMNNQGINTSPSSLTRTFFLLLVLAALSSVSLVHAQTTSFTYQGRFTDSGTAANGTYDMQFKLFDAATAGSQIGSTITNGAVLVNNGVFTVQLDYGAAAFSGADRYLEIGVRLAGDANPYTILAPRQQLTSAVYAIRAGSATTAVTADSATTAALATNATQLGGVAANQYVQTSDGRLSDARAPVPGSPNYIQNSTSPQATANFNVAGDGTAGGTLSAKIVNTTTSYQINGVSVLSIGGIPQAPDSNIFVGSKAGAPANGGFANSFFGQSAGSKTNGFGNAFFGYRSGLQNLGGSGNSFFGTDSGLGNKSGVNNSFLGYSSGSANETGDNNAFLGYIAGLNNKSGRENVFLGAGAGTSNETGSGITIVGANADVGPVNLTNATAIGSNAKVTQSNSLVLGSFGNLNGGPVDTNVGIGTSAPKERFHIAVNTANIVMGDAGCSSSYAGLGFGASMTACGNYSLLGNGTDTIVNRPSGGTIAFRENNVNQMSIAPGGVVTINTLGNGGPTQLCRNPSNQISDCGSSLRYKTNIQAFIGGLSVLNRLRPITFDWKQGGMHDLGFGAEDIAAIEPLLVTHNAKGEVEGVKYDRITAVLVNAVKEQQEQIKQLKQLVCRRNRRAAACR